MRVIEDISDVDQTVAESRLNLIMVQTSRWPLKHGCISLKYMLSIIVHVYIYI